MGARLSPSPSGAGRHSSSSQKVTVSEALRQRAQINADFQHFGSRDVQRRRGAAKARDACARHENLRKAADAQSPAFARPQTLALPPQPPRPPTPKTPATQPLTQSSGATSSGHSCQPAVEQPVAKHADMWGHAAEASVAPDLGTTFQSSMPLQSRMPLGWQEKEAPQPTVAASNAQAGKGPEVRYGSFRLALSFEVCGPEMLPVLLGDPRRLDNAKDIMRVSCVDVSMLSSPSDSWPISARMEDWAFSTGTSAPDRAASPDVYCKGNGDPVLSASIFSAASPVSDRVATAKQRTGSLEPATGFAHLDAKMDDPFLPDGAEKFQRQVNQRHAGIKEQSQGDAIHKPRSDTDHERQRPEFAHSMPADDSWKGSVAAEMLLQNPPRRPLESDRMASTDSVLLQNHSCQQTYTRQPDVLVGERHATSGRDLSVSSQPSQTGRADASPPMLRNTLKPSTKFTLPPLTMPPTSQTEGSTLATGSTLKRLRYEQEQTSPCTDSFPEKAQLPSIGVCQRQSLPQAIVTPPSSPTSPTLSNSRGSSCTSGFPQQLPQASSHSHSSGKGATSPNFGRRPGTRRRQDIETPVTPLNQGPFARPLTSPACQDTTRLSHSSARQEQGSPASTVRVPRIALRALRPTVAAAASILSSGVKALSGRGSSSDAGPKAASPRIDTASQLQDLAQLRGFGSGPIAVTISPPGGSASPCSTETLVSDCSSKGTVETQSTTDLA